MTSKQIIYKLQNFRKMKKQLLLLGFLMFGHLVAGQSLEAYLKIAEDNNPEVKANYQVYLAIIEKSKQVTALPDPKVSLGYFISPVETRVGPQQAKLSLSQSLPWFGTLDTKRSVFEEKAKAQLQVVEEVKNKLHLEVKTTWYQLFELERILELTKENLIILKTYDNLAISKYEVAQTSLVDVIRVQLQIEQNENELSELENRKIPLSVKFNSLLNRDTKSEIQISSTLPDVISPVYQSQIIDSLFEQIPRFQYLKYQKISVNRSQEVARLSGKPSFSLGLDYAVVGRRTDMDVPDNGKNIFMPMVSFSLPLNRKKYQAAVNEQIINQQKIEYQIETLKNNFIVDLENIQKESNDAQRNIKLYTNQIQMASQALDILTVNYSSAGKDFEEILRMQQQILGYRIAFEHARKDQYILKSKIEYLLAGN